MTDRSTNQAETRRKASSALARVFAVWRTGLPRPVLVLQGGNALNYFGTGLILPFEIIYLHSVRGFSTATAGLVLATVMGTAAVVTLPSGALLDRFSAKRILIAGNVVNALGYGGLAFVDRPWQGFVCSRGRTGFPSCCSGSALARLDRGQPRACDDRRRVLLLHPPAVCGGAYTCRARWDRCRRVHQHLLHRRSAGTGDTAGRADAPHSRFVRHQRHIRSRPARGPARNAHALDARGYHRLGRRRDPDCGR